MNLGTIWGRFVEKNSGKKSRATVSLRNYSTKIAFLSENLISRKSTYILIFHLVVLLYCQKNNRYRAGQASPGQKKTGPGREWLVQDKNGRLRTIWLAQDRNGWTRTSMPGPGQERPAHDKKTPGLGQEWLDQVKHGWPKTRTAGPGRKWLAREKNS